MIFPNSLPALFITRYNFTHAGFRKVNMQQELEIFEIQLLDVLTRD